MRNLKKVLSLALVFVMVFALMVSAGAVDYSDKDKITNTEAVEMLAALKIMTGRNGAFDPTAPVQRGELAKMLYIGSTGSTDNAEMYAGTANPFKDVPNSVSEYWGSNFVKWAYNKGIISGKSPTMFYPKDNVKGVEALKMALTALGYDSKIEGYQDDANWQYNIVTRAQDVGLLKDIPYDVVNRAMTRDEAAQMILNMLEINTVSYITYFEKPVLQQNGPTLMAKVFNAEKKTGFLMKTMTKGLGGMAGKVDNKDSVEVLFKGTDGFDLTDTLTKLKGTADDSLVGKEVNVYYNTTNNTLYGIFDTGNSSVVTDLKNVKYETGLNGQYVDGEKKAVSTATSYIIRKDGNTTKLDFTLEETKSFGKVSLTNVGASGGNAAYTAVTVKAGIGGDGTTLINRVKQADVINGADVAKDDLVVVSQQYNGSGFTYSVAKAETITGAISSYSTSSGKVSKLTINGTRYDLADSKIPGFHSDLTDTDIISNSLNNNGTFYLVDGKIVSYKLDEAAASNYGLILDARMGDSFSDGVVKIVLDTGATETMTLGSAKKTQHNSTTNKDEDVDVTLATDLKNQLVTYSIADGKINVKLTGTKVADATGKILKYNGGATLNVASTNYVVNDKTVFFVPSETNSAGEVTAYKVYVGRANAPKLSQSIKSNGDDADTGVVKSDNGKAQVVLVAGVPSSAQSDAKTGYIFGWESSKDSKGNVFQIVNLFDGGKVDKFNTASDLSAALKTGFINYTLNSDGNIAKVEGSSLLVAPQVADYSEGNYLKVSDTKMYDIASDAKTWTINKTDATATEGVSIATGENPTTVRYALGAAGSSNEGKVVAIYVVEGESTYAAATNTTSVGVTTNVKVEGKSISITLIGQDIKPGLDVNAANSDAVKAVKADMGDKINTKDAIFMALNLNELVPAAASGDDTIDVKQTNEALKTVFGQSSNEKTSTVSKSDYISGLYTFAVMPNNDVTIEVKGVTITIDADSLTLSK